MPTYIEQLSRATVLADPGRRSAGRSSDASLSCSWSGGREVAWVTVRGCLDDSTAPVLAQALRAVESAAIRVVELGDVTLGSEGMALPRAVLRSPRLVLKDPPVGLIEMLSPEPECCGVG
jgi:hypothetical protein